MKKIAAIFAALLLVTMLGGCYKADTTMKFGVNGGVSVTSTFLASKEMYDAAGFEGLDNAVENFTQTIELYSKLSGIQETGEKVELVRVDAAGNELAEGTPLPEDGSMVGARLTMKYKSLTDTLNSFTLHNFLRTTPLMQDEEGYGLKIDQRSTLFGTRYTASGKISVYGDSVYKSEYYDTATDEVKNKISEASNSITFKFPLAFSKSNADKVGFLGQSLTWTATAEEAEKDVYFEVVALNPLVLAMAIIIIGLLIAVIILKRKNDQMAPDAYFVDEEGNPIPVYDEEDEEEYAEEAEETEAEELTEGEELPFAEEAEEEPVIVEDEAEEIEDEEDTPETEE